MKKNRVGLLLLGVLLLSGCAQLSTPTQAVQPSVTGPLPTPQVKVEQLPSPVATVEPQPNEATALPEPSPTAASIPPFEYFGVEVNRLDVDLNLIRELGGAWIRYNAVVWPNIEAVEGIYDWSSLAPLEDFLKRAHALGLKVILIVRGTPDWAQAYPGVTCGPVRNDKLANYAVFFTALAARYSVEPYGVHHWEIGNEPDVAPELVDPSSPFGCWGNAGDPYYGGEYYAAALKMVVAELKRVDPQARVLNGGLLLDCDPRSPGQPGNCRSGAEFPPRFLEGMLRYGVGDWVDYLSFHAYPIFSSSTNGVVALETSHANWSARGGVVAGKLDYIDEITQKYGTQLPLFLSEIAFLCWEQSPECNPPSDAFLRMQAQYGTWIVTRNYAEGIRTIWYTFDGPGWRNGGILDGNQQPRLVYAAIKFTNSYIQDFTVKRKIEEYPNITGYEFSKSGENILFLAPTGFETEEFTPPSTTKRIFNYIGNTIPIETMTTLDQPVFIELAP